MVPQNSLIADAMRVIEVLETTPDAVADRRETLVALVESVCQHDGRPHGREAIEQAVDQVAPILGLALVSEAGSHLIKPTMNARARRVGIYLGSRWRQVRSTCRWFQTHAAGTIAKCLGWSALATATLWIPWLTILHGPFALAIHHTQIFYSLALFGFLGSILVGNHARHLSYRREDTILGWSIGSAVAIAALTLACSVGLAGSTGQQDGIQTLDNTAAVKRAFLSARTLPISQKASFDNLAKVADGLILADQKTSLRSVEVYDPDLGQVAWVADLNPNECALMAKLDPDFMITWVNGQKVAHPAPGVVPACPNLWHNRVQITNVPHSL